MLLKKAFRYLLREGKFFASGKPYFLNYPAATVCNHKCVMCNLHEVRRPKDITYSDLKGIVSDPLFENIESVGLSGGEPYMKKDIVEVCEVLLDCLPSLKHFSINTNGSLPMRFEETLPTIRGLCVDKGVTFNVVLSMDGVGESHDRVRGVSGAWVQLVRSIEILKQNNMTPSILMTIHRFNWSEVFKVNKYCNDHGIVPYFGIATVIERLDNEKSFVDFSLDASQKRYLWEFFRNLSKSRGIQLNKRIWYRLLSDQLMGHTERTASCVAFNRGVYLSDDGKLSYCGVYDKAIDASVYASLLDAYSDKENSIAIRNEMAEKHCKNCMHDYQSKPTFKDLVNFLKEGVRFKQIKSLAVLPALMMPVYHNRVDVGNTNHILLYGWFGTETTGDKAIYGEIISSIRIRNPESKIDVLSSEPTYTKTTVEELDLENVRVLGRGELDRSLKKYCSIVFCGGPIMGYADLADFLWLARRAKRSGIYNLVYGVGWGPFKNLLYKKAAIKFLQLADNVLVRDEKSFETLSSYLPPSQLQHACDPAMEWVSRQPRFMHSKGKCLGVSVRELSAAFLGLKNKDEYDDFRDRYLTGIAEAIDEYVDTYNGTAKLIPMNTFYVGGDDREILSDLNSKCRNKNAVELLDGFYSPSAIVGAFDQCTHFIGMRFHSTIFAFARNIPVIGVDYIVPEGKISAFFQKIGCEDFLVKIVDFDKDDLKEKLHELVKVDAFILEEQKERLVQIKEDYRTKKLSVL